MMDKCWWMELRNLSFSDTSEFQKRSSRSSLVMHRQRCRHERIPSGFLGSDYFQGLTPPDKKYLEYKWKMEWLPEAAAMEINTVSTSLLPEDSHQAMAYYKPADPQRPLPSQSHPYESPYWITLREQQVCGLRKACDAMWVWRCFVEAWRWIV